MERSRILCVAIAILVLIILVMTTGVLKGPHYRQFTPYQQENKQIEEASLATVTHLTSHHTSVLRLSSEHRRTEKRTHTISQSVAPPPLGGVVKLIDTVVGDHHLFSAYYDSRSSLPYRPAIVILGYRGHGSLYCGFMYPDKTFKCSDKPLYHFSLIAPNVRPEMYFCSVKNGDTIPEYIMLSANKNCNPSYFSNPIPVLNRNQNVPQGKVGVCAHGPIYTKDKKSERFFQLMVEFLAMSHVLGAKTVTMYSVNIDHAVLEKVIKLFPDFVEIIQWINLNNTLHYYGQRILLNDCIYRNMYRVDYLLMIDIDEMILPVKTNDWQSMIKSLESSGKYASFTFSNNFIEGEPKNISAEIHEERKICRDLHLPKYFIRMNRLPWPSFKQNTKMKLLLKPKLVSASCIHDICRQVVGGYRRTYWVPKTTAFMAHYRVPIDPWYVFGKGVQDDTAMKFRTQVMEELRQKCSLLSE